LTRDGISNNALYLVVNIARLKNIFRRESISPPVREDKEGETSSYGDLGAVSFGDYIARPKNIFKEDLQEKKKVATRRSNDYGNLGSVLESLSEYNSRRIALESACDQKRNWRHERRSKKLIKIGTRRRILRESSCDHERNDNSRNPTNSALADLIHLRQYLVEKQISVNPQAGLVLKRLQKRERK